MEDSEKDFVLVPRSKSTNQDTNLLQSSRESLQQFCQDLEQAPYALLEEFIGLLRELRQELEQSFAAHRNGLK